ncbi:MAG: TIGR03013 family PEP-CTERM/XrtA system glycosyltransferase [Burkholderiales bacterium]|nr:TIGR03013 family PEP-CTERM/XrtA system glycosyltransferase [Burkholderiales bacterium]
MRVFGHTLSRGALPVMVIDVVLSFVAVLLAASTLTTRYQLLQGAVPETPLILVGATIFACVMALMYAIVGLYRPAPISIASAVGRIAFCLAVGGYLTSLSLRVVADRGYIEQLLPAAIAYLAVGLAFVHSGLYLMRRVATHPRVLIVGTGPEALALAADLKSTRHNRRDVVGLYPTSTAAAPQALPADAPCLFRRDQSISDLVSRHRVQEIIVAVKEHRGGGVPMDELLACRIRGIPVLDLAAYSEKTRGEVPIDSLKGSWLVYGHGFVQGHLRRGVKRLFDIAASATLLVLLSPVILLAMLAIKLESPGPAIYRQQRVGLGGRTFWCPKLRSMVVDAEKDGVARWASKQDPRVTRVGALIRKMRIDELPQLWRVLTGEMSLVGPRPERPSFVEALKREIPFYEIRHTVKPGITGWAQVRYHYGESMEDAKRKHQFDLYYVKNNSLWLDLVVIIETVSVIAFWEGQ